MSRRCTPFAVVAFAAGSLGIFAYGLPAAAQFGAGGGGLGGGGFGGGGLGGGIGGGVGAGGFAETRESLAGESLVSAGGFGGGGLGGVAANAFSDSPSLFVLISPDKTRTWGYSTGRGEWREAPIGGRVDAASGPVVGRTVAVIADGRKRHAFSGLTGEWDTVELPEGAEDGPTAIGVDYALVRTKSGVSVFSAGKGKWATVRFAGE